MTRNSNHKPHDKKPPYLLIGEILRPHGVRGELRVRLLTDYPERIPAMDIVYVGKDVTSSTIKPYHIKFMRKHQDYGLLSFKEIEDRDEAERLRGLFIMVRLEDAVPLEADEIYLYQLIGLTVKTEDGKDIGTISDVLETGANDVYVIKTLDQKEILFPVTEHTVLETNTDDGYVLISPPEGLLPE